MNSDSLKKFSQKYGWIVFLLSVILLIILIAFMGYFFFHANGEAAQCLMNPMQYYHQKTNLSCSCFGNGKIYTNQPLEQNSKIPINLSYPNSSHSAS